MKTVLCNLAVLYASLAIAAGSEIVLGKVFLPLEPGVDTPVVVQEAPYYASGAFPEVWFQAITQPYVVQHGAKNKGGDINLASQAGISISCESAAAGQTKLYIIWDFSKAKPRLVNKDLIEGLLVCLEKTAGKSIGLYSKFVGAEAYPQFVKQIVERIPEQTPEQLRADRWFKPWSPDEQKVAQRILALAGANARREILKRHESTHLDAIEELWRYGLQIGQWHREYQSILYHRYSEQCFARCLRRGWLRNEDLAGLAADRIEQIDRIKRGLPKNLEAEQGMGSDAEKARE